MKQWARLAAIVFLTLLIFSSLPIAQRRRGLSPGPYVQKVYERLLSQIELARMHLHDNAARLYGEMK